MEMVTILCCLPMAQRNMFAISFGSSTGFNPFNWIESNVIVNCKLQSLLFYNKFIFLWYLKINFQDMFGKGSKVRQESEQSNESHFPRIALFCLQIQIGCNSHPFLGNINTNFFIYFHNHVLMFSRPGLHLFGVKISTDKKKRIWKYAEGFLKKADMKICRRILRKIIFWQFLSFLVYVSLPALPPRTNPFMVIWGNRHQESRYFQRRDNRCPCLDVFPKHGAFFLRLKWNL